MPTCALQHALRKDFVYYALTLTQNLRCWLCRDSIPEEAKLMCERHWHVEIFWEAHQPLAIQHRKPVPSTTLTWHIIPRMAVFAPAAATSNRVDVPLSQTTPQEGAGCGRCLRVTRRELELICHVCAVFAKANDV